MMTEYFKIKECFEMAEVLTNETENTLEIKTIEEPSGDMVTVMFIFDHDKNLSNVFVEK